MDQSYQIRDGIGFARFEGRTIVLDVAADRYWQIGEDAGLALEAIATGRVGVIDERALSRLITRGFVVPAGDEPVRPSPNGCMPSPADSALERSILAGRPNWTTACEVMALTLLARIALRARPLKTVLDRLSARRDGGRPKRPVPALEMLAQQFGQVRRLLPFRPLCLPDSIAFLWFAARRGHAPRLVFGVEAFPFTAHCWVQDGIMVLTDARDHARQFKPILVI